MFIRLAKEAGHTGEDSLEPSLLDKGYRWLTRACGPLTQGGWGWFRRFQYGYSKALVVENDGSASNPTPGASSGRGSTALTGSLAALPSSSSLLIPSDHLRTREREADHEHQRRARAERYVLSGVAAFEDHREDAVRADVKLAATNATAAATAAAMATGRNTVPERSKTSVMRAVKSRSDDVLTAGAGVETRASNGLGDRESIELRFPDNDHTLDYVDGDRGEHKGGEAIAAAAAVTATAAASAVPLDLPPEQRTNHGSTSTPSSSHDQSKEGMSLSAPSTGKIRVQLYELLRKRFITTSRDMKGFFFQIIFPAIQICLILAILTVSLNPAGHTVRLNASIYSKVRHTLSLTHKHTNTQIHDTLTHYHTNTPVNK